jgi:hypothetical protein
MKHSAGLAQTVRDKEPNLVKLGQDYPDALALGVRLYREAHGHAPSFERLQIFMQSRLPELGVPVEWTSSET